VTETVESRSPCEQTRLRLGIGHRDVTVGRRGALVELRCHGPAGARCAGRLALESTDRDTRLRPTAAAGFDVRAGTKKRVRIPVPAASRGRLARRRKAVVMAVARMSDGTVVRRMLSLYGR
jgi:hypothetical protein